MSAGIHRLVYYSRNRIGGGRDALTREVERILKASRTNNSKVGVTGALMFNAGCFAQVLEGPAAAVEDTFERIQTDERHGDVSLLAFEPAPSRAFQGWSMGFVGASPEDASRFEQIGRESGYDPSQMTGEALFEVLHRLALEEEQHAFG
jgi:hypothetical protein